MISRPTVWWSSLPTKFEVSGQGVRRRMSVEEMRREYVQRVRLREWAFDGPNTREGHSLTSAQEFYAEGYAVFFGGAVESQARLRQYAPELHQLLQREAEDQGLPVSSAAGIAR